MTYIYEIVRDEFNDYCIRATNGSHVLLIPLDEDNTDYQTYLAWVAEGNEPEVVEL